jgi:hypothetical protein
MLGAETCVDSGSIIHPRTHLTNRSSQWVVQVVRWRMIELRWKKCLGPMPDGTG